MMDERVFRLVTAGRYGEAVALHEAFIAEYQELAEVDRRIVLPHLARALAEHAGLLAGARRYDDAVAAAAEAVRFYREVATRGRVGHLGELAGALDSYAGHLEVAGRLREAAGPLNEALAAGEEAVAICRRAAQDDPEGPWAQRIADALTRHGERLARCGQLHEALDTGEQLLNLRRTLASGHDPRHLVGLADATSAQIKLLNAAGRESEALGLCETAVELWRTIAARPDLADPAHLEAHVANLSMALNDLGNQLARAGRTLEAVATSQETVDLRRALAARDSSYQSNLARSLNNHATHLNEAGRHDEAFATGQEAIGLWRTVTRDSDGRADLAICLGDHADRLMTAGRAVRALAAAHESLALWRELVAAGRLRHVPELAGVLHTVGRIHLATNQDLAAGMTAVAEAVKLFEELAVAEPDAFLSRCRAAARTLAELTDRAGGPR